MPVSTTQDRRASDADLTSTARKALYVEAVVEAAGVGVGCAVDSGA
jgi:hypothetical protein